MFLGLIHGKMGFWDTSWAMRVVSKRCFRQLWTI
jgi:hypothetical protein